MASRAGNQAWRDRILPAMADIGPPGPEVPLALCSQVNQDVLRRSGCLGTREYERSRIIYLP